MRQFNVLIACEFSGAVRDAFRRKGFNAWSCDRDEAPEGEFKEFHFFGDVRNFIDNERTRSEVGGAWDCMIAHPPCTHLAVSGARWFKDKQKEQEEALDFVRLLLGAPIKHIALENPVSIISSRIRRPTQIVQPWWFGHGETKTTCLWLKNLPKLKPTNVVSGRDNRIHMMAPSPSRGKDRSRTYSGLAEAMADQWGNFLRGNS